MSHQPAIREEELKNRVAALFFGKYDCTRIVGNIDFCVSLVGTKNGFESPPASSESASRKESLVIFEGSENIFWPVFTGGGRGSTLGVNHPEKVGISV